MPSSASPLPPAGSHGGDGVAVARALGVDPRDLLDLSQNMNPFAPPVEPLVARHLDAVGRYPDPREATLLLAGVLGVAPERLLLTNGGSEAIHVVTAVIGGRVSSEPEFGLHPRGEAGPLWRTDPHSPTGRLAGDDETADVWDEAFYALATGEWTAGRAGVVVGSLTKTFHCPGLRLGYVVADPEIINACAAQQPHWSVSALALDVVPDLLESADLPSWSRSIAEARHDLVALLESHGLSVDAADAPWVLIHEPGLREQLAPHGVLVRDCASFGLAGVARMAVPDSDGLQVVERALSGR
nr:aminotransferase class I/II-fold pyridoxal phosphate-dependent enzyme [Ornithinimicrobium sp. HY1745]